MHPATRPTISTLSAYRLTFICLIVSLLSTKTTTAQVEYSNTIRVYQPGFQQYQDTDGSPYIPGDSVLAGWLQNGPQRVPARLRYNSYTNAVEYLERGKLITTSAPIAGFGIVTRTDTMRFQAGFPATNEQTGLSFYQVLFAGQKTQLLKHVGSTIQENREAMSNDLGKKSFQRREAYFVWVAKDQTPPGHYADLQAGTMHPVMPNLKSLQNLRPDQAEQIKKYVTDNRLKVKTWAEFLDVLRYLDRS